jgi:phytoene desaturase
MYRLVEALMQLARDSGVEFVFDASVERIEIERDCARGVLLSDGSRLPADLVLANADLPYVYQQLLPQDRLAKSLARKRYSCSVISFFWGLDQTYPSLGPHTLFLADDYRQNFTSLIRDLDLPENPCLYLHAPARLDPSMSPPGQDTLIAIVPVGHMDENEQQDWGSLRDRARAQVFRRLDQIGLHDLESHIKFETTYSPPSWRKRYNLVKGATHGLSHTLTQLAYFRPHNRHPHYHNLYFVGASTHPGTGLPTALVSARLVSERIMDDLHLE